MKRIIKIEKYKFKGADETVGTLRLATMYQLGYTLAGKANTNFQIIH